MQQRSDELQAQAVALVRQYGFLLPKPVKQFLTNLADFLNWQTLKGQL
jgi:hypothetical protein